MENQKIIKMIKKYNWELMVLLRESLLILSLQRPWCSTPSPFEPHALWVKPD